MATPLPAAARDFETTPMSHPRSVPLPSRVWGSDEWKVIKRGCIPKDQEHRWFAYVGDRVLHFHRSWTGFEVYRARFVDTEVGYRVVALDVEADVERYEIQADAEETDLFTELVDLLASGGLVSGGSVFKLVLPAWSPRADGDARRHSAVVLAKAVLSLEGITMAHRREFLSIAIWKYTEADGKITTRYRSVGAIGAVPKLCHHEHVIPRKWLIDRMLAEPDRCEEIMGRAIGCCVLRTEHDQLTAAERADPALEGWDRYRAAGVAVVDLLTGETGT